MHGVSTRMLGGVILFVTLAGVAAAASPPSLLPTQQRIQRLGREVDLDLFPTGIALSADGRLLLATNNGFINHSLTLVDTQLLKTVTKPVGLDTLFIGVAISPMGAPRTRRIAPTPAPVRCVSRRSRRAQR